MPPARRVEVEVEGRRLSLSNLDKVMYPEVGFTKGQLIDSLSSDFEPEKYHDEYRERVLDLIERKAQGETIVIEEPTKEPDQVPDLMAALEASIAGAKGQSKAKPKAAPKKRAPAKKKAAAKT